MFDLPSTIYSWNLALCRFHPSIRGLTTKRSVCRRFAVTLCSRTCPSPIPPVLTSSSLITSHGTCDPAKTLLSLALVVRARVRSFNSSNGFTILTMVVSQLTASTCVILTWPGGGRALEWSRRSLLSSRAR